MKKSQTPHIEVLDAPRVKNKIVKVTVQIFVWILIIAFISTIGVGLGMDAAPVVIRTKNSKIDLSPTSIFMIQRGELINQLESSSNPLKNGDPRAYNREIDKYTLDSTMVSAAQKDLFTEISIKPSPLLRAEARIPKEALDMQYGLEAFFGNLGAVTPIMMLTIGDMYAFHELSNFEIATEFITLNKTNFLISQISADQLAEYFDKNIERWAQKVNVSEFIFENRAEARKGSKLISEKGYVEAMKEFANNSKVSFNTNKTILADKQHYNYFTDALKSYTSKRGNGLYVSDPIYFEGIYRVAVLNYAPTLTDLSPREVLELSEYFVRENYNSLSKTHARAWNEAKKSFETRIKNQDSFASIYTDISGAVHRVTAPFTVLSDSINAVTGERLTTPILEDTKIFQAILNTEINVTSFINKENKGEWLFGVRPLSKELKETPVNLADQQKAYMINQSKGRIVSQMFGTALLKRYNVKSDEKILTNLHLVP
ncbi:MAG: hypothetical protein ACRCS8_01100 [Brevinema sp.]